jgi:hypothetical protein
LRPAARPSLTSVGGDVAITDNDQLTEAQIQAFLHQIGR